MDFEIDVVSDATGSIFGERAPLFGIAEQLAAHDLAMVKPALLYGDHVTLHSGNFFTQSQIDQYLTRTQMPLQAVFLLALFSTSWNRRQLLSIGLTDRELPSSEEAEHVLEQWATTSKRADVDPDYNFVRDFLIPLAQRWDPYFPSFLEALVGALKEERRNLFMDDLTAAVESGVLEIVPHTLEPPNPNDSPGAVLFGEEPSDYQERAALEIAIRAANAAGAVLLDPWGTELSEMFGGIVPDHNRSRSGEFGMMLIGNLHSIRSATVREILDLRGELQDPLMRFRAAMSLATAEAPTNGKARKAFFATFYDREVAPAIVEIREQSNRNSVLRNALDIVKDPKEIAVTAGSLAMAAAVNADAILSAVSAITGLGVPVLRTLVARRRNEEEIAANPFYLLHKLS